MDKRRRVALTSLLAVWLFSSLLMTLASLDQNGLRIGTAGPVLLICLAYSAGVCVGVGGKENSDG